MERAVSFLGLFVMMGLAWLLSSNRRTIQWRTIAGGLLLQLAFAYITLRTRPGQLAFAALGDLFTGLLGFVESGTLFVFGVSGGDLDGANARMLATFAFGVLPIIIFFSSLMSILYHYGVMQRVVHGAAIVMQKTFNTSGAESLSVATNIFVGQVEAPLVVRPYLSAMTQSELMTVMLAGFATVAGSVMGAYVKMGISAGHLMTASVISAPAAIIIAKIMQPEMGEPLTRGRRVVEVETATVNGIDAAASGALLGLQLALQVAAIIIAFLALIAMFKFGVEWTLGVLRINLTLEDLLGYLFAPFALCMGIEPADCRKAGELLGLRMISNEFITYVQLGELIRQGNAISPRTQILLTYALCGFANLGSIGVQIGGIGAAAPDRQSDLARLGLRAMLGGTLACFMTACVAGLLLEEIPAAGP
jgi:CNT family concentrative nucleoside transporter